MDKSTKMKAIISFVFFFCSFSTYSQTLNHDTLKVIVQTKFGELTFRKSCETNKFEFIQSKVPIFDKKVEAEALEKKIEKDSLEVKFSIDKKGKITSFEIVKKSRIDKLNIFLSSLFNDAIFKMRNKRYSLSCNNKESVHIIPLIYVSQKSKPNRITERTRVRRNRS